MWSISKRVLTNSWQSRQYSQHPRARCQTSRMSAASMCASESGALLWFDTERPPGLGSKDVEHDTGPGEGEQFFLLGGREGILLVAHGQVVHPGLIPVAEIPVHD